MDITRRNFIKLSGAAGAGLMLGTLGFDLMPIEAYATGLSWADETKTICCFCACGCGVLACGTLGATVTHVEGDPDHVINEGTLCSKGSALYQTGNQLPTAAELATFNSTGVWPTGKRLTKILHRAAGATEWTAIDTWSEACNMIADRIKTARAAKFDSGNMATPNIAALGGAAHDNEECALMRKLYTALGMVYIEHQARI